MIIEAPQVILVGLLTLSLVLQFSSHGKPRKPYNGWMALSHYVTFIILLLWGGFLG